MVARDRGQLLLLGGLAMAIVFLAVIPLSNSLVVTESASTAETVHDIDRTADREATITAAIRSLANRTDAANNTDEFNRTLRNYSTYRMQVRGQQSGTYINTTMNMSASEREISGTLTPPPNFATDNLVTGAEHISVLTVTGTTLQRTNNPDTAAFTVRVYNDSGYSWRVRAYREPPSDDIVVETTHDGVAGWQSTGCTARTPVTLNIAAGTCTAGGTTGGFDSNYTVVEGPYNVEFNGPASDSGTYRVVSSGEFPLSSSPELAIPYVDIFYQGPETSYERTISTEAA